MPSKKISAAVDTAATPPSAARLLLFGLWAVKFDVTANKLFAFTPKMPGGHMGHTYFAGNWQSSKATNVVALPFRADYQVVASGTKNADMQRLIPEVLKNDYGIFINANAVDCSITECLMVDLGLPTHMYPLLAVETAYQFAIRDTTVVRAGKFYPGVWAFAYEGASLSLTVDAQHTLNGTPTNAIELITSPEMEMSEAAAAAHAAFAYAQLMTRFSKRSSPGTPLDIEFNPVTKLPCDNTFQGMSGIDPVEADCKTPRPLFEKIHLTGIRPANCAAGSGTLHVP